MSNFFSLDSPLIQFLNKVCDVLFLSIVFTLCCIPIITIGPAVTALYYATVKVIRRERGYLMREFFRSFKLNFKSGAFLTFIFLIAYGILYVDIKYAQDLVNTNGTMGFIMSNLIYIIVAIVLLCFIAYAFLKNSFYRKKVKKEDRLYYLDAMTNLKNRNYLNDNIEFWNSSKIYPQAIIIIDINKLKTLNDKYGHEAGDNQIRSVASVLIRTQKDNTEILRTDGDEFMIYLVGYDEKKVGSYIHKLNREIQNSLSNRDYGVSIGYSMINNEQTTIDDAINDSLMMIRKSKGVKNEK